VILRELSVEPLFVPLREPFVIASARMDTTLAGLVRVRLDSGIEGLGEAATLPPVTREQYADVETTIQAIAPALRGRSLAASERAVTELLEPLATMPVARAGIETAILDAISRAARQPMAALFGASSIPALVTDITLPIAEPARMVELAREWHAKGFRMFKVKVGKDLDQDLRAITGVHRAVDAEFRLDANEGFTADEALALLRALATEGVRVECFEQPCRRVDLDGMAKVQRDGRVVVVADESVRSLDDLERVHVRGAASAVNLKLVKHGGPIAAYRIGRRARELEMKVMCGAMVETRLGLTAMAHVVGALGGADYVDLDTAFLLSDDPFEGGYTSEGATLTPTGGPGLDVRLCAR
jgi:L-Ala-D/L-Glu epimerase